MTLNNTDIASLLFKSKQGKSSTNNSREFFEEPRDGRPIVFGAQIWTQVGQIPTTAPTLADQVTSGVVQYWEDLSLTAVAGTTNSFASDNLKDAIPFNFGDGTYNYGLKSNTDAAIAFGQGDWIVDAETGTLTFYGTTPSNMPPKISFYKYVGSKSDGASPGDFNETIDSTTAADLSDYAPATNKIVFTNSGVTAFQSIVAGSAGDRLLITNSTGAEITVTNEDAGETAANRISTGTGADIAMPEGASFLFNYDGDSDTWRIVGGTGSGSGGGESDPKQLIIGDNRNFETSVGGWIAYDDGGSVPTDGTGAAPDITFTQTATTPLVGAGMGVITKDAVDRQGQGISLPSIAVPDGYQGKPLLVRAILEPSAAYVAGDIIGYMYDETNTNLLGVIQNANSGSVQTGKQIFEGLVYPSSDTASLSMLWHIATTNASAYTVNVDEIQLEWVPYTKLPYDIAETVDLAGSGQITTGSVRVTKMGNAVTISGLTDFTHGSSTDRSSAAGMIPEWARPVNTVFNCYRASASVTFNCYVEADGSFGLFYSGNSTSSGTNTLVTISYTVDSSTNSVNALAINSGLYEDHVYRAASLSVASASIEAMVYDTVVKGENYNTSTGEWTCPRSGRYDVLAQYSSTINDGEARKIFIRDQTGTAYVTQATVYGAKASDDGTVRTSFLALDAVKGNIYTIMRSQSTSSSRVYNVGAILTYATFKEVPFSQTALISTARDIEIVLITSPGHGSTATRIRRFTTIQKNTAQGAISYTSDATNGDSFTILQAGLYAITFQHESSDSNREFGISINQASLTTNVTGLTAAELLVTSSGIAARRSSASVTRWLEAGDIIRAATDGGATVTGTDDNRFSVTRI